MTRAQLSTTRFVVAIAVSLAIALSSPFLGQIRSSIRSAFPRQFVWIVGGLVAAAVLAALVAAVMRVTERRGLRYASLAASIVAAAAFTRWHASGVPDVDVVEVFHFVEYGLITLLFYRAWRPVEDASIFILPFLAAMIAGTIDEALQWFVPARVGEVNDVLLNGVAIGCGLLFSFGVDPPARVSRRLAPGSLARIGRVAFAAGLSLAAFVHIVHLGYLVSDAEAGSFVSRYSRVELERLDRDKREAWQAHPLPQTLQRISREDQYMSEGVVHVQERNRQWTAGNARDAWQENLILEKYFDAVLDAPSYVSATGHRWPAAQRADAATRLATNRGVAGSTDLPAGAYVSQAYPYPLYLWSKRRFWMSVAPILAGLLLITALLDRH
jgi:VanZ like family